MCVCVCACTVSLQCACTVLHTVCRMLPRTLAYIYSQETREMISTREVSHNHNTPFLKGVSLVEFMYLVFTRVPCELLQATPTSVVAYV